MDSKEVWDALVTNCLSLMDDDYADISVTNSFEQGMNAYANGQPFICITIDDSAFRRGGFTEDSWQFQVNMAAGPKSYAGDTTEARIDADSTMTALFRERFNSQSNFDTLVALGIYADCRTWPENQRDEIMINPHLISATTYE